MAFEIDAIFPKRFTLFMKFVCAYLDGEKFTQFLGELCICSLYLAATQLSPLYLADFALQFFFDAITNCTAGSRKTFFFFKCCH